MKPKKGLFTLKTLALTLLAIPASSSLVMAAPACKIYAAARLFDGNNLQFDMAVKIVGKTIAQVAPKAELNSSSCAKYQDLGDATILPGFIESHAHVTYQHVRKDTVLDNGITTVQDTGGPLMPPEGGVGKLRLLSVGPILQAPGGYPINIFGTSDTHAGADVKPAHDGDPYQEIGLEINTEFDGRTAVQHLADHGATAVKIALEPGGETGAPWMQPHGANPVPPTPWDILPEAVVKAIVDEAHNPQAGRKPLRVIAHVGENVGFQRALNAGVDELAHMPCAPIDSNLLAQGATTKGLTFVTTVDTLSSCVDTNTHMGIHSNTAQLAAKIAECEAATPGQCAQLLYGSEIGHDNVPWGINGEEMHMMLHLTSGASVEFNEVLDVFRAATSKAGAHLGIDKLGTLQAGAPADVIAVRGNPIERFKLMENPDLVVSGGRVMRNKFK